MDPYEEVAQQGQAPPLSPAYVPDPWELGDEMYAFMLNDASAMAKSQDTLIDSDPEETILSTLMRERMGADEPSDDDDDDDDTVIKDMSHTAEEEEH
ncbi:hypothetical protein Tco_0272941 [Tanacetum coccineum]